MRGLCPGVTTLLLVVTSSNFAKAQTPDLVPATTATSNFNWTGWYIGANAGVATGNFSGQAHASPAQPFTTRSGATLYTFTTTAGDYLSITDASSSAVAGGQFGANLQFGNLVFGFEGDFDATDLERSFSGPGSSIFITDDRFQIKNDWQASIRARAGFAFQRWMAYATGGAAWAHVTANAAYSAHTFTENSNTNVPSISVPGGAVVSVPASSGSDSQTLLGFTVGAGLEYALTNTTSVGIEYRYTDYGSKSFNLGSVSFPQTPSTVTASISERTSAVTARLNYRFYGGTNTSASDRNLFDTLRGAFDFKIPTISPRVYGGAEYLLWFVKGAPLSVPLVTTGTAFGVNAPWV